MNDEKVTIQIIKWCAGKCEGRSIYINDYRVAGSKPYGGGTIETTWIANKEDILKALNIKDKIYGRKN